MNQSTRRKIYGGLTVLLGLVILIGGIVWVRNASRRYHLTLTSGQKGGMYLPLAQSIKEVVDAKSSKIRISVLESMGSGENLKRIISGEADLALGQNDSTGQDEIRTLTPLYRDVLHFIVREEVEIHQIQDLRGKIVAWGPDGSGSRPITEKLLAHFEIATDKVDLRPMKIDEACRALHAGNIDALLLTVGVHSEAVHELAQKRGIRFIPFGSAINGGSEIEGFRLHYPFAQGYLIPTYAYAAQTPDEIGVPEEPIAALSIQTLFLCRENLPDHVARELTRIIHQNRSALLQKHPGAAQISEGFDRGSLQFPVHNGAEQFYRRDEPGWMATYADLLGFVFSIIFAIGGFLAAARQWWIQNQKDRIDEYYLKIDEFFDKIRNPKVTKKRLLAIRDDLAKFRHDAIKQLAEEKLVPDESFRIFQTLLHDCNIAVDRRLAEVNRSGR